MLPTFTVMSFTSTRVVLTEKNTVEPPLSYQLIFKEYGFAYGRWSLTIGGVQGGLFREEVQAHLLYER